MQLVLRESGSVTAKVWDFVFVSASMEVFGGVAEAGGTCEDEPDFGGAGAAAVFFGTEAEDEELDLGLDLDAGGDLGSEREVDLRREVDCFGVGIVVGMLRLASWITWREFARTLAARCG